MTIFRISKKARPEVTSLRIEDRSRNSRFHLPGLVSFIISFVQMLLILSKRIKMNGDVSICPSGLDRGSFLTDLMLT